MLTRCRSLPNHLQDIFVSSPEDPQPLCDFAAWRDDFQLSNSKWVVICSFAGQSSRMRIVDTSMRSVPRSLCDAIGPLSLASSVACRKRVAAVVVQGIEKALEVASLFDDAAGERWQGLHHNMVAVGVSGQGKWHQQHDGCTPPAALADGFARLLCNAC
jgi:hypothetical protein